MGKQTDRDVLESISFKLSVALGLMVGIWGFTLVTFFLVGKL